jgi:hypothetical protein
MHLPAAIQVYFEADTRNDREAVLACFAPEAIVGDEGRSHVGHDGIARWWEDTKARYRPVAVPLEASTQGQTTRVRARVSGAFPGSPAVLTFGFVLAGDTIAALEIGA